MVVRKGVTWQGCVAGYGGGDSHGEVVLVVGYDFKERHEVVWGVVWVTV